jgi:hypothetical protein
MYHYSGTESTAVTITSILPVLVLSFMQGGGCGQGSAYSFSPTRLKFSLARSSPPHFKPNQKVYSSRCFCVLAECKSIGHSIFLLANVVNSK